MKRFFIALFFACHLINCSDIEQKATMATEQQAHEIPPFATNSLFVFLRSYAEKPELMDIVADNLLFALHQQAGPILASSLLLYSILKQPTPEEFLEHLKKTQAQEVAQYEDLINRHNALEDYIKTQPAEPSLDEKKEILEHLNSMILATREKYKNITISEAYKMSMLKKVVNFDPYQWIIKKVNDHILLLIPKNYVEKIMKKNNKARFFKTTKFSELELNLGIKIDLLQNITSLDTFVAHYSQPSKQTRGKFFVNALESIFITNKEYAEQTIDKFSVDQVPQWVFYLVGHGNTDTSIADLSIDNFKKMLAFLEKTIVVKLFIYTSCFAGGFNAVAVYKDLKTPFFKTYPFTIVLGALTDAEVIKARAYYRMGALSLDQIDFVNKKVFPLMPARYNPFLEQVTTQDSINFKEILENLFPEAMATGKSQYIFGSPQIKLPGIPWFNVVETDEKLISLGTILALTRKEPLNIMTYFKRRQEPQGILLYANSFPFELIIPTKNIPLLIPMLPDKSLYLFKKITINTTLDEFFKAMLPLAELSTQQLFSIQELETRDQSGAPVIFKNIIMHHSRQGEIAFYATSADGTTKYKWDPINAPTLAPFYPGIYGNIMSSKVMLEKPFEGFAQRREAMEKIGEAQQRKLKEIRQKKAAIESQFKQFPYLGRIIEAWALAHDEESRNGVIKKLKKFIDLQIDDMQVLMPEETSEKIKELSMYKNIANSATLFLLEHQHQYDAKLGKETEESIEALKAAIEREESKLKAQPVKSAFRKTKHKKGMAFA